MVTLLGSLIGFISALVPDALKLLRDQKDKQHELKILEMQMEQQRQGHSQRLEEIRIQAEATETQALYQTYHVGVTWVDALNGTVRPVLAYAFFVLYAMVKLLQFHALGVQPFPWQITSLWNAEDQAIFAGIISFYFGQRAMSKLRK